MFYQSWSENPFAKTFVPPPGIRQSGFESLLRPCSPLLGQQLFFLEIVCVDPALVKSVWPLVAGLIRAAMQRGDVGAYHPVEENVLAGRSLVWLATDGTDIHAAAVTQLERTDRGLICVIVACGGRQMCRWLHLIEGIEEFARAEGCAATRIVGRKGWARVLPSYRAKRIILEKELR
jgi:hypothetical protein